MKMIEHSDISWSCTLVSVARNRKRRLIPWALGMLLLIVNGAAVEPLKHLYILSGQSNMTGGLKVGFSRKVDEHYGEANVTVVHHCKPGRGIRFWDKDYRFPANYRIPGKGVKPSARSKQQHGEVYGPLIEKVRAACQDKSYDTITLVWMQGESDGMRGLGDVYEESFLRLLGRLKTDLNRQDLNFVIGRINSAHLTGPSAERWRRVREVQVKIAKDAEWGAWIDTDDLSKPSDGVHFPSKNYPTLGERFADKAIELVQKRTASPGKKHQGDDKAK